jgi:DNA-directed RNA polymerase subunit RPC12/RpoP
MKKEVNIDLNKMKAVQCEECGHTLFTKLTQIKIIPGILIGQPGSQNQPVTKLKCESCGHIQKANYIGSL